MSTGEGQTPNINIALLTEGGASRNGFFKHGPPMEGTPRRKTLVLRKGFLSSPPRSRTRRMSPRKMS